MVTRTREGAAEAEQQRAVARMPGRDLVAYVDDDSLRDLLMQLALHPLRVGLGFFTGLCAAILFLLITQRSDLSAWVATFGPFGTPVALHFVLRLSWRKRASDVGLHAAARKRLRELIDRAPMPLTPTSDSVDKLMRHLRK